jgi:1-acyl-sn-glycerol-3-phosphate acyltransferase
MQKPNTEPRDASGQAPRGVVARTVVAVSRGWRIFATGLSFVSFGLLSVVLAATVMPLLRIMPGSEEAKVIRAQRAIHSFVRVFLRWLEILQVGRFEASGAGRLREPGHLIVANHPSLLDAMLLISLMPQADCVIKGSHLENPFMGGAARGAGFIPNWEGPSLVDACAERLMQGRSVIIFPEGTRSPVGDLGRLARGAAHIALRAGRDPIPVTIRCDPATLSRGIAWWDVPRHRFTLSANVGDPLLVKDFVTPSMTPALAARAVTRGLREHFESELGWAAAQRGDPDRTLSDSN